MCGKLWGKIMTFVLALLIIMPACAMTGCSGSKEPDNKTSVDYTVVENADLPEELKKLIESKKDKVMRLTYTTKDYTYVVAGYGTRETSGYSIKVNDVYTGDNALYIDLNLIGPAGASRWENRLPLRVTCSMMRSFRFIKCPVR